jgi:hypothetical protein
VSVGFAIAPSDDSGAELAGALVANAIVPATERAAIVLSVRMGHLHFSTTNV